MNLETAHYNKVESFDSVPVIQKQEGQNAPNNDVQFGLTTREAHRWRVSGKKMLRIIFDPDKVEVIAD